jgi:hypothetical protein
MSDVDEYIVNLLVGLVHLRIFELDGECPIMDGLAFIMKAYNRVPHLEYISVPPLDHYYKRVGGELVICDQTEFPLFR